MSSYGHITFDERAVKFVILTLHYDENNFGFEPVLRRTNLENCGH